MASGVEESLRAKKGCCGCTCYALILNVVNFFMLLGGAVLTGVSSWGVQNREEIKEAIPPSSVTPILVAGIFLFILGLMGIVGSCCNNSKFGRCFLLTYSVILTITMLLELAAGAVILQAMGTLDNQIVASASADSIDVWINETYVDCCFLPDGTTPRTSYDCWTARHSSVVNEENCMNEGLFREQLINWLQGKLHPVGAAALAFFVIQFVVVIAACCSYCGGKRKSKHQRLHEDGMDPDDLRLLESGVPTASPQPVLATSSGLARRDSTGSKQEQSQRRKRWQKRWAGRSAPAGQATLDDSIGLDSGNAADAGEDSDDSII